MASSNPHVIAAQQELEPKWGEPADGYIQPHDLAAAYEHLEQGWKWEIDEQAPSGGADGDVLTSNGGQAEWQPLPEAEPELPDGGQPGEFLGVNGLGNVDWLPIDIPDALPGGGGDGDVLTLTEQPDGSLAPTWQAPPAAGTDGEAWELVAEGDFAISIDALEDYSLQRPTDVGTLPGHGFAHDNESGPVVVYGLGETSTGDGNTALHSLDGNRFDTSADMATEYRATVTVDGQEYEAGPLTAGTITVTNADGSDPASVPVWTFYANGLPMAPQTVSVRLEALIGDAATGGCFPTYGEAEAAIDAGCAGGGGDSGSPDLADVLARLQALEDRHTGALADHVPTYGQVAP